MSSCVYVTGHIKDPAPLFEKRRGLPPGGQFSSGAQGKTFKRTVFMQKLVERWEPCSGKDLQEKGHYTEGWDENRAQGKTFKWKAITQKVEMRTVLRARPSSERPLHRRWRWEPCSGQDLQEKGHYTEGWDENCAQGKTFKRKAITQKVEMRTVLRARPSRERPLHRRLRWEPCSGQDLQEKGHYTEGWDENHAQGKTFKRKAITQKVEMRTVLRERPSREKAITQKVEMRTVLRARPSSERPLHRRLRWEPCSGQDLQVKGHYTEGWDENRAQGKTFKRKAITQKVEMRTVPRARPSRERSLHRRLRWEPCSGKDLQEKGHYTEGWDENRA